ncbi:MAG: DEAD/DEAH box helicase [Kiritimatiellia bacterium]
MELKSYQIHVMEDIGAYLDALDATKGLNAAWARYWDGKGASVNPLDGVGVPGYYDDVNGAPNVCIKVPTGGGKTFLATCAVRRIFDRLPPGKTRFVMWLVPSDAILTQTVANLGDPEHPYRQRLNADFGGAVNVYTKEQLLNGQNFSPDAVRNNLSVCVFCYASIRTNPKKQDDKKIYQENGNLLRFADWFDDRELLLADTPETALIQVIRQLNPVTIVDESHNVKSSLSIDMLKNINPSFILSMTATPAMRSNIISYVNARELKKDNMVKLPVIVYNRPQILDVINDAVHLRGILEAKAREEESAGGAYVRPIVLFQAQSNVSEDSTTFDKIKRKLVGMGIPEGEIAIKTAQKDEIGATKLLSSDCPIRYVITVNALKEGWDCPFAYILASLANRTSKVDVEQIVGRILRQPYARRHAAKLLNMSYVLASSNDFNATVTSVVEGLNGAGFSSADYRVAGGAPGVEDAGRGTALVQAELPPAGAVDALEAPTGTGLDELSADARIVPAGEIAGDVGAESAKVLADDAEQQGRAYDATLTQDDDLLSGLGVPTVKSYKMEDCYRDEASKLRIPQFVVTSDAGMFGAEKVLLDAETLLEGFTLSTQDATVDFNPMFSGAASVDLADSGDVRPKSKLLTKSEMDYLVGQLSGKTTEERLRKLADAAGGQIDRTRRHDSLTTKGIRAYALRVMEGLPAAVKDQLVPEMLIPFSVCVRRKIEALEDAYKRERFARMLAANEVVCEPMYELPPSIAPGEAITHLDKSLYEGEYADMNADEVDVITRIAATPNVRWWHRIRDRRGFALNGFITHYPDFLVVTEKGCLVLVEVKGPHLDGSDSQGKLELGMAWSNACGMKYKYFMVFRERGSGVPGAVQLDEFLNTIEKL